MYSEDVPLWAAVLVVLVIVATAVVAWVGARRATRSLFDASKAVGVSLLFGTALASWLALAFLIVFLPRPENTPAIVGAVIVLAWNLALITVGYGLRYFSGTYREVVDRIPSQRLLAFQSYRLVGAIFLPLMAMGLLPAFFAVPAGVGDIIAGLAALGAACLYAKRFAGAWSAAVATNLLGMLDFVVALGAGSRLLAAPLQAIFGGVSATTGLLSVFPLGLIPLFVVPLGFIVHLHSLTRLFAGRKRAARPSTAA
ncbi:MAG: hypothetical protein M3272_02125 [Actinomycetota bacterium]|nr:hypothetical protein [Actinomycetota bacterium]